jgi:hypothetical protein
MAVVTGKLRVVLGCDTGMSVSPTKICPNGTHLPTGLPALPLRVARIAFGERIRKNVDKLIE